jgi:hypothetical protein
VRRRLHGWLARRAERARHNDFDVDCVHWWGDRDPDHDDHANRDLDGDPTRMDLRRCLICRPYGRTEADALVERDLIS